MVIGMLLRTFHPDDLSILHIAVHAAVVARATDSAQRTLHFNASILTGDLGLDSSFQISQGSFLLRN